MSPITLCIISAALLALLPPASSFGITTVFHDTAVGLSPFLDQSSLISSSTQVASLQQTLGNDAANLLEMYKQFLVANPLQTKMITGGTLAVAGDAIAQKSSSDEEKYDKRRAFSFMLFDMCYRAVQHASFPVIVQQCRGQFLGAVASSIPPLTAIISSQPTVEAAHDLTYYFGAVEQTLASQLIIVPFFYYPVFFTLTGFIQGLTPEQAFERAKTTFLPLMKRNLLFWLPVQFVQFSFIDEGLQIPFLSLCGLGWTFILSVMAGSTKSYGKTTDIESKEEQYIEEYCITGAEECCNIDDDHMLPGVFDHKEIIPKLDYDLEKVNDKIVEKDIVNR